MEEIANYLREVDIDLLLQEVWENNRVTTISAAGQSWSESILTNIASLATKPKFSGASLRPPDPPHWSTSYGVAIHSINDVDIAEGYDVCADWKFDTHTPLLTDNQGWQYNRDFTVEGWVSSACMDSAVRHRKWFRILVSVDHMTIAKQRLVGFMSNRCDFRSLNPHLIGAALSHWFYQLQFVMECQRYENGLFAAENLRAPGIFDPAPWCVGSPDSCVIDPSDVPVTELVDGLHLIENNPCVFECLTEFMFLVYPNRDVSGWQYNSSFQALTPWNKTKLPEHSVRRRVWFRSFVPHKHLYICRQALREYIELHPRGTIRRGMLHRLSHYRKRWTSGLATLTDRAIILHLQHNYQSEVHYTLEGCEVVGHLSEEDLVPGIVQTTHQYEDGAHEADSSSGERAFMFGLRFIGSGGKDEGLQCVLSAASLEEREDWVMALTHQVALVNPYYWALPFGPPVAENVVIRGDMWKRGHLVPSWKFRRFELRQNGTLAYYKGNELKGKIRLRGCNIVPTEALEFQIVKQNGYLLSLRASDIETKDLWIGAITSFVHSTTPKVSRATEEGRLALCLPVSYANPFQDIQHHHQHQHVVFPAEDPSEQPCHSPSQPLLSSGIDFFSVGDEAIPPPPPPDQQQPLARPEDSKEFETSQTEDSSVAAEPSALVMTTDDVEQRGSREAEGGAMEDHESYGGIDTCSPPTPPPTIGVLTQRSRRHAEDEEGLSECGLITPASSSVTTLPSVLENEPEAHSASNSLDRVPVDPNRAPTHTIQRDASGHRVSVLAQQVVSEAEEHALWGGDDSDESEEDESVRCSSISYVTDGASIDGRTRSSLAPTFCTRDSNSEAVGSSSRRRVSDGDSTSSNKKKSFSLFGFGFRAHSLTTK